MMRATLVAGLVVLPSLAAAQQADNGDAAVTVDSIAAAASAAAVEATSAAQQASVVQEPPRTRRRRRRPSMVGYIGDSSIGSRVRIRFDTNYSASRPDRAEFLYAKCGCFRSLAVKGPAAFDPDAPGPGPGVVTDLDFQQLYLRAEYAAHTRISVFGELPVRWVQPQAFVPGLGSFGNQAGFSDIRFGVKLGAVAGPERRVTLRLQISAPTGDALKGLGTHHWSVEPTLLYFEQVTDRFAIEGQLGEVIPTDGSAGVPTDGPEKFSGSVLYYGIGPSYEVFANTQLRIAPVVELVGWWVNGGFETAVGSHAESSGTNIVNLKVGVRLTGSDQSSIYLGYGHALTEATWYDNIIRVEYRTGF